MWSLKELAARDSLMWLALPLFPFFIGQLLCITTVSVLLFEHQNGPSLEGTFTMYTGENLFLSLYAKLHRKEGKSAPVSARCKSKKTRQLWRVDLQSENSFLLPHTLEKKRKSGNKEEIISAFLHGRAKSSFSYQYRYFCILPNYGSNKLLSVLTFVSGFRLVEI